MRIDVINTNLNSVFNVTRPVIEGMRERKWGACHPDQLDQRPQGPVRAGQLRGSQSRHVPFHPFLWRVKRPQWRDRQYHFARLLSPGISGDGSA